MSKAFTKEDNSEPEQPEIPNDKGVNYVTSFGFAQLQSELKHLLQDERPKVVTTVRWAAGNGDRSENGDYIYGKKRLREIDRRVRYLTKRIDSAKIVNPRLQQGLSKVFFGATVTYQVNEQPKTTVKIVGVDEADLNQGKISFKSPVAKALMKAEVGDKIKLRTPKKTMLITILDIQYEIR